jgi:hypothetical protein
LKNILKQSDMKNFIEPLEVDFEVVNRNLTQDEHLAVSNHIAAFKARALNKKVVNIPEELITEERSNRVVELLHQIDCVNEMIRFHKDITHETTLINQYQHQKVKFLQSLQEALTLFEVEMELKPSVA